MAYDIDGRRKEDTRIKVNNMTFPSGRSGQDFPRCLHCIDKPRLQIQKDTNGNRVGVCVKSCGQTFQLEEKPNEETGGKHYVAKYPTNKKDFIISQPDKNKKKPKFDTPNAQLTEEDVDDIRKSTGISPN
jgi:hypothetical protein